MAAGPDAAWFDVVVVGGANMDYLVKAPTLPQAGSTVEGELFQEAPGGKGMNQAVAVARLGGRAALVACVGADDRGDAIVHRLSAEGVDARAVLREAHAPTGVALIAVDAAGEKQIVTAPGANGWLTPAAISGAGQLVARAKVLLAELEVPLETVASALHLARAAGARVVLDPAPPIPLPEEMLHEVHVVRLNAAEAAVLTGIEVTDRATARRAAENLMRRGVRAACVAAPGGNLLLSDDAEVWLPNLTVKVVDTTGAGDAFAGALALALAERQDLRSAASFANAAAALATTSVGAQAALPHRGDVIALLDRAAPAEEQARPG